MTLPDFTANNTIITNIDAINWKGIKIVNVIIKDQDCYHKLDYILLTDKDRARLRALYRNMPQHFEITSIEDSTLWYLPICGFTLTPDRLVITTEDLIDY